MVDGRYTSIRTVVRATSRSAPGNQLTRLELTSVRNGSVELGGARLAVPSVVLLRGTESSFVLYRQDPGAPFQADYLVSDSCGDKAQWIADGLSLSTLSRYPNVRAVIGFDIDKAQEQNWAIRSSSNAYSAFNGALNQSHFMADASGLLPIILAEHRTSAGAAE